MLLSFNWLKQYVKLPDSVTPEAVAEKLKLATVEVEKVERQGAQLENIVVGKILKYEKHPNADKLKVCEVDIGAEKVTVVCGGSNVREGMLVALAKTGARVRWHGAGELVELKPTKIRGVESQGMICASDEIGLSEMFPKKEEKEIFDLSVVIPAKAGIQDNVDSRLRGNDKLKPGTLLADILGLNDTILEIDNKSLSHRPDLWGHYGFSREAAALFNRKLEVCRTKDIKPGKEVKIKAEIKDSKLCSRYLAVAMSNIRVAESPRWLKQRLAAVGCRPLNNIVDITNYVMLDLGQPMHAFDGDRISEIRNQKKIMVRRAQEGEKFVSLDGKEHVLTPEMLVIANEAGPLALAGVMGGEDSGITSDTATIIFESANFAAASIRKTSVKLGLRTDSSARFEKSLDPAQCELALKRAVELTQEICPGATVASAVAAEGAGKSPVSRLTISVEWFAQKLGVKIDTKIIIGILERLGFAVALKKGILQVSVPSWRATGDITIAEDVVEEVARIYGYDNIPASLPSFPLTPPEPNKLRALERAVADVLVRELAYTEVYNYSFVSAAQIAKLGDDGARYLELDNPLSKEKPYLRRHLLDNLLENLHQNIDAYPVLRLWEVGQVFHGEDAGPRVAANSDELLPRQDTWLTAIYVDKANDTPFGEARRAAETISKRLAFTFDFLPPAKPKPWQHPARAAALKHGDRQLGLVYELHPRVAGNFGLAVRVGIFSLNLSALAELTGGAAPSPYQPVSLYPAVMRDIAFIVRTETTHAEIVQALQKSDPLIKKTELFDVFAGQGVKAGHQSLAYHLTYIHPERTLTSAEVDAVEQKIIKLLQQKFNAEIRS
ncbi:MAG: phenylalanine--tRNA ligase subunit beta [Candidatus Magasanikbacteria bacterium]|nr:phenylalanine--tRNA ligase subunit beta [Candidatus Magasanikbacteria bacterium]